MNTKIKLLSLATASILFSLSAFAQGGGMGGNGGLVTACRDSHDQVILPMPESMDHYQNEQQRHIKVQLKPDTRNGYVVQILARLAKFSPIRAKQYAEWAKTFDQDTNKSYRAHFSLTEDAGNIAYPQGCGPEQLIIQNDPKFEGDARYQVNGDLWEKMDAQEQAIMIVHEMFVREKIHSRGATDTTEDLRYFNAMLAGDRFSDYTIEKFNALAIKLRFLNYVEHPLATNKIPYERYLSGSSFGLSFDLFAPDHQTGSKRNLDLVGFEPVVFQDNCDEEMGCEFYLSLTPNETKVFSKNAQPAFLSLIDPPNPNGRSEWSYDRNVISLENADSYRAKEQTTLKREGNTIKLSSAFFNHVAIKFGNDWVIPRTNDPFYVDVELDTSSSKIVNTKIRGDSDSEWSSELSLEENHSERIEISIGKNSVLSIQTDSDSKTAIFSCDSARILHYRGAFSDLNLDKKTLVIGNGIFDFPGGLQNAAPGSIYDTSPDLLRDGYTINGSSFLPKKYTLLNDYSYKNVLKRGKNRTVYSKCITVPANTMFEFTPQDAVPCDAI